MNRRKETANREIVGDAGIETYGSSRSVDELTSSKLSFSFLRGLVQRYLAKIEVTRRTYTMACTDARAFVAQSRVETQ